MPGSPNAVRSPMVAGVGARIRSLRTARGLTQAQVAEPQYTKAYISMLESGRTRASMKALEHIAGVLGVQPADLLGGPAAAAAPQYELLEARRLIEQGRAAEASAILAGLEEGLSPADQLVRLRSLAAAHNLLGQAKQAFPLIERAQRMAELLDDPAEVVRTKAELAASYAATHAYLDAIRLYRECIQACDDGLLTDPPFLFRLLADLSGILTLQRQPKQALAVLERAIALAEGFADRVALGALYAGLASTHRQQGDIDTAIVYSRRSLQIFEELSVLDAVAGALDHIAALQAENGNRERARECLARGAGIAQENRRDGTLASIRTTEAEIAARSDPAEALELAQAALKLARKADHPGAQVRALILLGELKMAGNGAAARRSFQDARTLAEERAPHLLRATFDRWSRAAESAGDSDEALRLARRALELVRA